VIATAWTDQALVYILAVARTGIPLVAQFARLRGPVAIYVLKQENRYQVVSCIPKTPKAASRVEQRLCVLYCSRVDEIAYKVAAGRGYPVIARSRKGHIRSGGPCRGSGNGVGTRTGTS